jgi:four helix bundle protein
MEQNKNHNFTDLIVWQKAVELFELAAQDAERFPDGRPQYLMAGQMVKSAGSIGATIAEGYGRGGPKGFGYRLLAARGYAYATQDWYHKMARLGYLPVDDAEQRLKLLGEISRMLSGLIAKVSGKKKEEEQQ